MPSALHPRSAQTFSLFTTTLVLSFLVVGLPHILPCPVPHTVRAESSGDFQQLPLRDDDCSSTRETPADRRQCKADRPPRRKRRKSGAAETEAAAEPDAAAASPESAREKIKRQVELQRPKRTCPIPKPGGLVGQILGVREDGGRVKAVERPIIKVESIRNRRDGRGEG